MTSRSTGWPVLSRDHPLVFGHRGGARLGPENTLIAFQQGLAAGADGFECDVHLSRDGVPVVIHDQTLDRTTDTTGPVRARTADELARIDAGYRFESDGSFPFRGKGHGVPRLADVLDLTRDRWLIIEMKQGEAALARAVIDTVKRANAVDRVCVGSFYRNGIDVLRREEPAIVTSACEWEARWTLYRSWLRWPFRSTRPYRAFQVPQSAGKMRVVSPAFLAQAHRDASKVQVWVVDDPADIRRLLDWGVDGIISDRPDVAVKTRDEWLTARGVTR